jgi:hypothetical protein
MIGAKNDHCMWRSCMVRRLFNWKTLLLAALCLILVGLLLSRCVGASWFPSAKHTSIPPAMKRTPTAQSTVAVVQLRPLPTADPALTATAAPTPPSSRVGGQRQVIFVNKMQETIWVAAASSAGHTLAASGWVLPAGASVSITIPDAWNGRFWGRTGCSFDSSGHGHCETGDCAGHFQCGATWGAVPATLAEYNLNSYAGLDFYDVSLVDGANLPMWINNSGGTTPDTINAHGCSAAGCTKNVLDTCPAVLQIKDASGTEIACDAACNIFHTDQYCCRGAYAARALCDPTKWPVNYAQVFKAAEPFAYSYPDDDATSTLTCKPECNYRITFGVSP